MRRNFLALAAGGLCIFLVAWQHIQGIRLAYKVEHLQEQADALAGSNAYLRLEMERRMAPMQLAQESRRRLGMTPPTPEQVVVLK